MQYLLEQKSPTSSNSRNTISIVRLTLCLLAATSLTAGLTGCETIVDNYGVQRQVISPQGAAVLDTLVATGVGAGSGALLKDQPGWMNGMISALSGSVTSQLVNAVATAPQTPNQRQLRAIQQQNYGYNANGYNNNGYNNNGYYQDEYYGNNTYQNPQPPRGYNQYNNQVQYPLYNQNTGNTSTRAVTRTSQQGNSQQILYTRLPNGQFIPINP
jgi:hypothetical protein